MAHLFKKVRSARQSLLGDADRRTRLGNVLALLFITAGFVLIGLAWNGAASKNFIQRQFPYLISGGVMGLGLIVTGMLLALMSALRSERRALSRQYDEVITLLGRNLARLGAGPGASGIDVVAAGSSYHRPGCRVLEGKPGAIAVSLEQAAAERLSRCRVCEPPEAPAPAAAEGGAVPSDSEGDRAQVAVTAAAAPAADAPDGDGVDRSAAGDAPDGDGVDRSAAGDAPDGDGLDRSAAPNPGGATEALPRAGGDRAGDASEANERPGP